MVRRRSFTVVWFFCLAGMHCGENGTVHLRDMTTFISFLQLAEESNPLLSPLAMVTSLRRTAGHEDQLTLHFLGASNALNDTSTPILDGTLFRFFDKALHHAVTDRGEERGVALAPDGSTVALAPLLLGVEAGLRGRDVGGVGGGAPPPRGLVSLTLAQNLGLSFLKLQDFPPAQRLGPDGCWDRPSLPLEFRLSRVPTMATDALVHGGMDGLVLGTHLAALPPSSSSSKPSKLSAILREYYNTTPVTREGQEPEEEASGPRSTRRREASRDILGPLDPQRQIMETLALVWRLEGTEWIAEDTGLEKAVRDGVKEFVHRYWDCPPIIPRCQWGADPPKGTPIPLALPLPFLFLHHTLDPGRPCRSFPQCSRDMRAMQRFHQTDRGWEDIAYSFVVGSNGYVYEGRGWHSRGRHTRGQNAVGYGVAIVGDYSSSLPGRSSLALVRRLARCAVDAGRLAADYTLHGHRQLVNYTACPGEALFTEIRGWEHFRETDTLDKEQ